MQFPVALRAQPAKIIKLNQLDSLTGFQNDTTYVINFWATWCKPCVEEMPYFLEAEKNTSGRKFRFIFISLDFKRQFESRLIPFLKEKKITSTVYLLDEPDYDRWINKVDQGWEGNIPGTLIYNFSKGKREFHAKEFQMDEFMNLLDRF